MKRTFILKRLLPVLALLLLVAGIGLALFSAKHTRASDVVKPVTIAGRTTGVPPQYFGMHFHYLARDTVWPEVGIGSWRFWNSYTAWTNIEARPGAWDFGTLDKSMAIAEEHKVEPLVVLGMTPRWASTRPDEHSPYGKGASAEVEDLDDWRGYVRKVVRRYKGRVPYYEIWNEPDLKETFTGTPEKMAELTIAACKEIRAHDPAAKIVGPALTSGAHAFPWYERFLAAMGPSPCFDVMGWHFYTAENAPERLVEVMAKVRAMQKKHGIERMPVWNTESGYFLENDDGPRVAGTIGDPDKLILNSELATAYLMRSMILGYSLGIERFYWYAWDDEELGLREPKTRRAKRSGTAYGTVQRWMIGSELSDCGNSFDPQATRWRCTVKKNGREAFLLWSTKGFQKFTIPKNWQVVAFEEDAGNTVSLPGDGMSIGEVPVLLKREPGKW
ncbi:MAG: hypothetical protein EOP38_02055 [Rubrivivax sp.]|nr:MAG: hypothetical protein EOP38_02055 [Rubrivivax sp.]